MIRFVSLFVVSASLFAFAGCATTADDDGSDGSEAVTAVSETQRTEAISRAHVWSADEFGKLATKDLGRGQPYAGAPMPGAEVVCKFVEPTAKDELGGHSAKFQCGGCTLTAAEVAAGKKPCTLTGPTKVKFSGTGRPLGEKDATKLAQWRQDDAGKNGEVFAEPASTRLLWALGFYADGVYPVKLTCYDCPENPWDAYRNYPSTSGGTRADRRFEFAAIEVKAPGKKIETKEDEGFNLAPDGDKSDIIKIDAAKGGSSKDEVEALKLIAAFLYDADNKPENQRLYCADGASSGGTCTKPLVMLQDIGTSLGKTPFPAFLELYAKADLGAWSGQDVWKDRGACQANLSSVHELSNPKVTEGGRALLSKLMNQLTDAQLAAIFGASRVAERGEKIDGRLVTVDDWVATFKKKREQLAQSCGGS